LLTLLTVLLSQEALPDSPDIFSSYRQVLDKHIDLLGRVDYSALKDDSSALSVFIQMIESVKQEDYALWVEEDQIAFWLNVYNAFTLQVVLDHYPLQGRRLRGIGYPQNSIRQIPGVWKKFKLSVLQEDLSLDFIEHQILRRDYKEPGIHMALVCAARSCPPLRREPYTGTGLRGQLDDQARIFLSLSQNFRINRENNIVYLSSIFKWFRKDFIPGDRSIEKIPRLNLEESAIVHFIIRYIPESSGIYLRSGGYRIKYIKYDWTLNDKENP